jgi:alpha-glucosidase
MWPEAPPSTAGYRPQAIELHLFVPGSDGTHHSFLQEDDGVSFAALDGARYRTSFELTRDGDRLRLRADVEGDGYPEFAREEFHVVIHGAAPATARLGDGTEPRRSEGHFVVPNAGEAFALEFALGSAYA